MASRWFVEFQVLGTLETLVDGEPVALGGAKQRRLLAALVVNANAVVSVDRLADILWSEDQPAHPGAALHTYVSRLRATLEPNLVARDEQSILLTRVPGYLLSIEGDQLDATRFEKSVASARLHAAEGDCETAAETLRTALGLWRGNAYAEFADLDFARTEALRLEELRRVAIEDHVDARLALGEHADVIGELEGIIQTDLLRERPRGQLMLALYRCGRQPEALRVYDAFRVHLANELGIEPSPSLRQLEQDILEQSPALAWRAGTSASIATEHRGRPADPSLTNGTLTFLFTDIEGSTRLWQDHPDAMVGALARHDAIVREAVEGHRGRIVKHTGDGAHAVFTSPGDAVDAAISIQAGLTAADLGIAEPLRARVAIHSGTATERDGDYFGTTVNRAARIMAAGHGGQILTSLATRQLLEEVPNGSFDLRDLGEYRLRDLDRPDRLFQVAGAGLLEQFPPLRSTAFVPGNLPAVAGPLVGRDEELAAVSTLLHSSRLVTITGSGGIGKTTLSAHVARQANPEYPGGTWFCELAAAERPDTLVEVIAAALGVQPAAGQSLEESVAVFLRERRALVVLDNCEHVVDRAARLVAAVLHDAPDLRLLATSREPLGVAGEHTFPLGPLALPDPAGDIPAIAANPSVRVFVARAKASRPDFELTAANVEAVAELCRHLDGIPLALELAAARVAVMTPRDILDRLDERFRLLTGGPRTVAERHQTLRAAVDWSYSLLDDAERAVFARLGVFAGSFDLSAAEYVAADNGASRLAADDVLARLVTKSMVTVSSYESTTRYQLLETLRDFALEHLDDADASRRRHATFYARFAEAAGVGLLGPDEPAWRSRVRVDLDNLRAAVHWALASDADSDSELALRTVAALAREASRDRSSGIGGWAERSLAAAATAPPPLRAAVRAAAAQEALGRDDLRAALPIARDAVADGIPPECPAPGYAYSALATAEAYSGRTPRAAQVISDGLAALDAGEGGGYARAALLAMSALLRVFSFDPDGAITDAEAALQLARPLGNPSLLADALYALSWACFRHDPERSLAVLDECAAVAREGGAVSILDGVLGQAARLRARRGDGVAALELLREALVHSQQTGYRRGELFALSCAVEVFGCLGSLEAAVVASATEGAVPLWDPIEPEGGLLALLGTELHAAALERAAALTVDGAVSYAVAEIDRLLSVADASR